MKELRVRETAGPRPLLKMADRGDGVQQELTGSGHRPDAHDVQPEKDQVRDQQRGQPHSK
jgi:hypothetical protein